MSLLIKSLQLSSRISNISTEFKFAMWLQLWGGWESGLSFHAYLAQLAIISLGSLENSLRQWSDLREVINWNPNHLHRKVFDLLLQEFSRWEFQSALQILAPPPSPPRQYFPWIDSLIDGLCMLKCPGRRISLSQGLLEDISAAELTKLCTD